MSLVGRTLDSFLDRLALPRGTAVGVAVSGGADSLCLAFALKTLAEKRGLRVRTATVDHGLRLESADEAAAVARLMHEHRIEHTILTWRGVKPLRRIEECAREKRYELLEKWCRQYDIRYLFLAHHGGDQAETFWARLARGSGLNGLTAMRPCQPRGDIILCRPFLSLSKSQLQTDLKTHRIHWFEDTMNIDPTFERVRWRMRQEVLSEMGLSPDRIGLTISRLQRVRDALNFYVQRFWTALTEVTPQGYIVFPRQALDGVPSEIRLRLIARALGTIQPSRQEISLAALERWEMTRPRQATLGGCVMLHTKSWLFVVREAARMTGEKSIRAGCITSWNRFYIWASRDVIITGGGGDTGLPAVVRRAVPKIVQPTDAHVSFMIGTQKELEKKIALDYNRQSGTQVFIAFNKGNSG